MRKNMLAEASLSRTFAFLDLFDCMSNFWATKQSSGTINISQIAEIFHYTIKPYEILHGPDPNFFATEPNPTIRPFLNSKSKIFPKKLRKKTHKYFFRT